MWRTETEIRTRTKSLVVKGYFTCSMQSNNRTDNAIEKYCCWQQMAEKRALPHKKNEAEKKKTSAARNYTQQRNCVQAWKKMMMRKKVGGDGNEKQEPNWRSARDTHSSM